MSPKEKSIDLKSQSLLNAGDINYVALRDEVLQQVATYCSNQSQDLWLAFCSDLAPQIINRSWDQNLQLEFLKFRRLLDKMGIAATELILNDLQNLAMEEDSNSVL
ncbi:MAG: hypothetical protein JXR19_06390 [Bacteroidia bacterium]